MSMKRSKTKRERRLFTPEYKAEAVQLALAKPGQVSTVARNLDLTDSALRNWVKLAKIDAGHGPPGALNSDERSELARLRLENQRLQMERDFLKKAAAFFAKDLSK
jgi:transposase-like protein